MCLRFAEMARDIQTRHTEPVTAALRGKHRCRACRGPGGDARPIPARALATNGRGVPIISDQIVSQSIVPKCNKFRGSGGHCWRANGRRPAAHIA